MKKPIAETTASDQQGGNMRVIYHGYALTTYGPGRVSITDREGREVYSGENASLRTEEVAKEYLKEYLKGEKHGT